MTLTACGTPDEHEVHARAEDTPLPGRPVPPLAKPPGPAQLGQFVQDREAAIALGKALFWDMQVGSDDVQACASCHFNAGADSRSKNQISPGLLMHDPNFEPRADHHFDLPPNRQLVEADYPFRKLADPLDRTSTIVRDTNDVASSQGVYHAVFAENPPYGADPDGFAVKGVNVRRVEPRNTPTVINAVYNHRNFWDGRAQSVFNGANPFGERDPNAHVYRRNARGQGIVPVKVRLDHSSLASQAVGPPTNEFEMSAKGRTFPDVGQSLAQRLRRLGRKLEPARPLGLQKVHPQDSVLGKESRWPQAGLRVQSYGQMIRKAFRADWWSSNLLIRVAKDGSTSVVTPGAAAKLDEHTFTLLEYNFSLFFGIAVQMYEATLISDDTPFDRYLRGDDEALNEQELHGLDLFFRPAGAGGANCLFCHGGPELTLASTREIEANGETQLFAGRFSDRGYFNIGVRPAYEDLGLGGLDPFGKPLSEAAQLPVPPSLPDEPENFLIADGLFKASGLRNVALTAPYFHNGGTLTLDDVVEFYVRGGDVRPPLLTRDGASVLPLAVLDHLSEADKEALAAFLRALTDERVLYRKAPFDGPQLFVPNGSLGDDSQVVSDGNGQGVDEMIEIPAVGRHGGAPLPSFLGTVP